MRGPLLVVLLPLIAVAGLAALAQSPSHPPACGDAELQHTIRTMMLDALDESFRDQIGKLYTVWMADERAQPGRARAGTFQAISAYVRGRKAIEEWKLDRC